jgi:hypothetical protein
MFVLTNIKNSLSYTLNVILSSTDYFSSEGVGVSSLSINNGQSITLYSTFLAGQGIWVVV